MERYTIVGIDENTALVIDPRQEMCTVVGTGTVTILRAGLATVYAAGERFAANELGDFHRPVGMDDIDGEVWQAVQQGRQDGAARRAAAPQPDTEVQALLSAREQARAARNWQESDRLRDELERRGLARAGYGQRAAGGTGAVTMRRMNRRGWSDREAAKAVRGRIDVKYLLGLALKHQGFHHSALGAFRQRLVENSAELRLLEELLAVCRARGFVKAGGRQRTDSTPVVAAVQTLNRLECVHETLRLALERVAELEPEWLQAQVPPEWYEWYGRRLDASQMAKRAAEKERWQVRIGASGWQLLLAVQDERTPAYLRQLPALQLLQCVWIQQYWVQKGRLQWRTDAQGLPPSDRFIQSPHDPEARFRTKRQTKWTGYMVHLTETCDDELPHLVVNVETTPASTGDADMTAVIHTHLAAKNLLPAEHYVDTGYQSAANLVTSNRQGIDLIGPAPVDTSWQVRRQTGFDVASFDIDWDAQFVICPAGKRRQLLPNPLQWVSPLGSTEFIRRGSLLVRSLARRMAWGPKRARRACMAASSRSSRSSGWSKRVRWPRLARKPETPTPMRRTALGLPASLHSRSKSWRAAAAIAGASIGRRRQRDLPGDGGKVGPAQLELDGGTR